MACTTILVGILINGIVGLHDSPEGQKPEKPGKEKTDQSR